MARAASHGALYAGMRTSSIPLKGTGIKEGFSGVEVSNLLSDKIC